MRQDTKSGSVPKRSERQPRRRAEEVFAAAVEVFNERGYAATSVEDVAAALGILKGSLYYYIDSKEDLLFRIVSEVHEEAHRIIEDALGRTDLDPRERIALYVWNQAHYNALEVARVAVYYRDVDQLSQQRLSQIRSRQREHFRSLVDLIVEAQASGLVTETLDPTLAAHGVIGAVIWPYTWFRPNGKVKPRDLADFCVSFALSGLGALNIDLPAHVLDT